MYYDLDQSSCGVRGGRDEGLPRAGEAVWVRCGAYWVLAYCDEKSVWKELESSKELKGITSEGARNWYRSTIVGRVLGERPTLKEPESEADWGNELPRAASRDL